MSIQGVQPKLSARLNVAQEIFEVVDTGGEYILKPQSHYVQVPENEDLTMRLAAAAHIEVPGHGLIYSKDGSLTYFIRRFDRAGRKGKIPVEDFAQLAGKTRDTKYDSSMEQVASLLDQFATFPVVEKVKLFRLTIFNFVCGNEDMHLKNFSIITREGKRELSPAYDLLNTTLVMDRVEEEIALPLDGKKRHLTRSVLVEYFGRVRLQLRESVIQEVLTEVLSPAGFYEEEIRRSFLSASTEGPVYQVSSIEDSKASTVDGGTMDGPVPENVQCHGRNIQSFMFQGKMRPQ